MKAPAPAVWRIEVRVPARAAAAFADALDAVCEAVLWPEPDGADEARVTGFCGVRPAPAAVRSRLAARAAAEGLPAPAFAVEPLPPTDWLAENRRSFPPIERGRYFIHGRHHRGGVPPGRLSLCIDAGGAFGSGEHPTTGGCLAAFDDLARRRRFRAPLDLGCGSGILALAIARTWKVKVVAADIDDEAVAVTRRNARLNGMSSLVRAVRSDGFGAPAVRRGAPYDLIVANILAGPLCRLATDLGRRLAPGGVAVLSGLVEGDLGRVVAAQRGAGLRLVRRIAGDGWPTLVLVR